MNRSVVIRGYINILLDVREKLKNGTVQITESLLSSLEAVGVNLTGYRKEKNKEYTYTTNNN